MLYLIKLNIILALLCLLFQVLMHRDTFFGVRRAMLWGIYLTAFLLPLCDVQALLTADAAATDMAEAYASYVLPTIEVTAMRVSTLGIEQSEPGCGMWFVGVLAIWAIIYLIPVVWMILKLLWQFAYIIYLRCTCPLIKQLPSPFGEGAWVRCFPRPCSPFSFGPWIFLHAEGMDEQTLREVLIHEQAHVRGWHTLDILFSQVVCILFWWNPAAWLMRREVRMNLEFIADKAVADSLSPIPMGGALKAYQYRLLGFATQTNVATIANNFNVLPLKRRIIMMNLRRTRRTGMAKYILFVPVAAAMLLLSNIDSLARTVADKASSSIITDGDQRPDESPNITKPDTCLTPIDEETLFVVNGRQMNADEFKRQPNLKADNIESATILGKESATAVYGAKGHKGAIIIDTKDSGDDKVYETCEQLPEYPGGQLSLLEFMMKNIRYPKAAHEYGVQGKVIVSFIVEKDGTLTEVKAAKIVGVKTGQELPEMSIVAYKPDQSPEETKKAEEAKRYNEGIAALKAEAERAVKALPKRWNPGKDKGKPVRVSFHLPVTFRLQ